MRSIPSGVPGSATRGHSYLAGWFFLLFSSLILVPLASSYGAGTTRDWNGSVSTNFETSANWTGGLPADSTTKDAVIFSGALTAYQPSLTTSRSLNGIFFYSSGWTLGGSSHTLLMGGGGQGGITNTAASGTNWIGAKMELNVSQSWEVATGGTLDVLSPVSAAADDRNFTKTGGGTLIFRGTNTYGGATTVRAGKLIVFSDGALGTTVTGTTVSNGATLSFAGGFNYATAESLILNGAGAAGSAGALENIGGNNTFAGPIRLGSSSTIGSASGTLTLSGTISNAGFATTFSGAGDLNVAGVISGSGSVTKTGTGTVTLSGNNTFTGGLAINGGSLILGASDRIANSVNLTLGGGKLASGGYNETLGTLTLTSDSIIDFGNANSIIHFAAITGVGWTPNTVLLITNWTGTYAGGGSDQLFFGTGINGLTGAQLGQIQFVDNFGNRQLADILANGEVVPVPEPATILAILFVGGLIGYRERKGIALLWRRSIATLPGTFSFLPRKATPRQA